MKDVVLVVDREEICKRCRDELEKEGYEVWEAHDGDRAVEIALDRKPDAVVTEIYLPAGMDGLELMTKILSEEVSIPVIIHTESVREQQNFLSWCAEDYVVKSPDLSILKRSLDHVLHGAPRQGV